MPTFTHAPAAQIEKHILENPGASNWLLSTFELAIQRDPVDALQDAEVLVTALRTRSLDAYSVGALFNAQLTAALLQQHADALGQLGKNPVQDVSPSDNARLKGDISVVVMQLDQVARELCTSAEPSQPTDGETSSQSVTGQLY